MDILFGNGLAADGKSPIYPGIRSFIQLFLLLFNGRSDIQDRDFPLSVEMLLELLPLRGSAANRCVVGLLIDFHEQGASVLEVPAPRHRSLTIL